MAKVNKEIQTRAVSYVRDTIYDLFKINDEDTQTESDRLFVDAVEYSNFVVSLLIAFPQLTKLSAYEHYTAFYEAQQQLEELFRHICETYDRAWNYKGIMHPHKLPFQVMNLNKAVRNNFNDQVAQDASILFNVPVEA